MVRVGSGEISIKMIVPALGVWVRFVPRILRIFWAQQNTKRQISWSETNDLAVDSDPTMESHTDSDLCLGLG